MRPSFTVRAGLSGGAPPSPFEGKSPGGKSIHLWVTQPAAIAFYETCGFVDDGRREPLVHTLTVIEVGMMRPLNPARAAARRDE